MKDLTVALFLCLTTVNDHGGELGEYLPRVTFAYITQMNRFHTIYMKFGRQARIPVDAMYV